MSGFQIENERDDIQLANERATCQTRENKMSDFYRDVPTAEYGTSQDAEALDDIVLEMIDNDCPRRLLYKESVDIGNCIDINEAFHDAIINACVNLGLSTDSLTPELRDLGHQVEITL